jgi:c(7)-type cytochrome triheme protein
MKRLPVSILFIITVAAFLISGGPLFAGRIPHGGDIVYTKPVKSVLFSHKLHVEDLGLSCEMCHPKLFEMQALHAQDSPDFTMNALYKGKYCGACHNGKTAFASNTQCARCHNGVKGYEAALERAKIDPSAGAAQGPDTFTIGKGDSEVKFVHDTHTANFKCGECHTKLFAFKKGQDKITMAQIYEGKFCGACHNGKKAFASSECSKCHAKTPAPKADLVYKPEGIGVVKFSHAFHTKSFGCGDCHTKIFAMKKGGNKITMDTINAGNHCGKCHNGKTASDASDCTKCHAQ